MVAELPVMLDVLVDDLENDFFGEDDDDFIILAAAASIFERRNLNRILGYFEQTIAMYSLDEFKAHFPARMRETFDSFRDQSMGRFPGVVGAVDGTFIRVRAPMEEPQAYVCRKKFHALQLQVVCDDNMMLRDTFTGWPGSVHDSRVRRNSSQFRTSQHKFGEDTHLLGDGGYPLLTWLITPFRDNGHVTRDQRKFNKVLSSLRQVVERAIGLLKGRWRKLSLPEI
ncbi:putative nuclease HARBI1 [Montipora foliosa]|uniref:putative nuclease HARBI1 n=1 Tax=Montipora foliosa TaxID=591990 RepID=UPI0035F1E332